MPESKASPTRNSSTKGENEVADRTTVQHTAIDPKESRNSGIPGEKRLKNPAQSHFTSAATTTAAITLKLPPDEISVKQPRTAPKVAARVYFSPAAAVSAAGKGVNSPNTVHFANKKPLIAKAACFIAAAPAASTSVSYTHLTLPTKA